MNRDHTAPFRKKGPKAKRIDERDLRGALEQAMENKFLAPVRAQGVAAGKQVQAIFLKQPIAKEIKHDQENR